MHFKRMFVSVLVFFVSPSAFSQTISSTTINSAAPDLTVYISRLQHATKCQPTEGKRCEVLTNKFADILDYLRFCNRLTEWVMHYQRKPTLILSFSSDGSDCKLTVTDNYYPDKPQIVTCKFTENQIKGMMANFPNREAINQAFASGPGKKVSKEDYAKIEPVAKCLHSLPPVNRVEYFKGVTPPSSGPQSAPKSTNRPN